MKQSPLKRYTRLKPIGRKGRRLLSNDKKTSELVRSKGYCELAELVPNVLCFGPLAHHHIVKRGILESRHDTGSAATLCYSHHAWVHNNPDESRKLGLIKDSKSNLL